MKTKVKRVKKYHYRPTKIGAVTYPTVSAAIRQFLKTKKGKAMPVTEVAKQFGVTPPLICQLKAK
jgi:hypothetical protein